MQFFLRYQNCGIKTVAIVLSKTNYFSNISLIYSNKIYIDINTEIINNCITD